MKIVCICRGSGLDWTHENYAWLIDDTKRGPIAPMRKTFFTNGPVGAREWTQMQQSHKRSEQFTCSCKCTPVWWAIIRGSWLTSCMWRTLFILIKYSQPLLLGSFFVRVSSCLLFVYDRVRLGCSERRQPHRDHITTSRKGSPINTKQLRHYRRGVMWGQVCSLDRNRLRCSRSLLSNIYTCNNYTQRHRMHGLLYHDIMTSSRAS